MTIYFIQPEGEPFVKIGYSKAKAAFRIMTLQVGNHRKLRLLASVIGTQAQELGLHFLLRQHHCHGEWFHLTPEVEKIISEAKRVRRYRGPTVHELKHHLRLKTPEQRAESDKRRGPRKRTKKDRRMPWDQVAKFYFHKTMSNAELLAIVSKGFTPMSYDTMRRHFGKPRGALVGRPSARRAAPVL